MPNFPFFKNRTPPSTHPPTSPMPIYKIYTRSLSPSLAHTLVTTLAIPFPCPPLHLHTQPHRRIPCLLPLAGRALSNMTHYCTCVYSILLLHSTAKNSTSAQYLESHQKLPSILLMQHDQDTDGTLRPCTPIRQHAHDYSPFH